MDEPRRQSLADVFSHPRLETASSLSKGNVEVDFSSVLDKYEAAVNADREAAAAAPPVPVEPPHIFSSRMRMPALPTDRSLASYDDDVVITVIVHEVLKTPPSPADAGLSGGSVDVEDLLLSPYTTIRVTSMNVPYTARWSKILRIISNRSALPVNMLEGWLHPDPSSPDFSPTLRDLLLPSVSPTLLPYLTESSTGQLGLKLPHKLPPSERFDHKNEHPALDPNGPNYPDDPLTVKLLHHLSILLSPERVAPPPPPPSAASAPAAAAVVAAAAGTTAKAKRRDKKKKPSSESTAVGAAADAIHVYVYVDPSKVAKKGAERVCILPRFSSADPYMSIAARAFHQLPSLVPCVAAPGAGSLPSVLLSALKQSPFVGPRFVDAASDGAPPLRLKVGANYDDVSLQALDCDVAVPQPVPQAAAAASAVLTSGGRTGTYVTATMSSFVPCGNVSSSSSSSSSRSSDPKVSASTFRADSQAKVPKSSSPSSPRRPSSDGSSPTSPETPPRSSSESVPPPPPVAPGSPFPFSERLFSRFFNRGGGGGGGAAAQRATQPIPETGPLPVPNDWLYSMFFPNGMPGSPSHTRRPAAAGAAAAAGDGAEASTPAASTPAASTAATASTPAAAAAPDDLSILVSGWLNCEVIFSLLLVGLLAALPMRGLTGEVSAPVIVLPQGPPPPSLGALVLDKESGRKVSGAEKTSDASFWNSEQRSSDDSDKYSDALYVALGDLQTNDSTLSSTLKLKRRVRTLREATVVTAAALAANENDKAPATEHALTQYSLARAIEAYLLNEAASRESPDGPKCDPEHLPMYDFDLPEGPFGSPSLFNFAEGGGSYGASKCQRRRLKHDALVSEALNLYAGSAALFRQSQAKYQQAQSIAKVAKKKKGSTLPFAQTLAYLPPVHSKDGGAASLWSAYSRIAPEPKDPPTNSGHFSFELSVPLLSSPKVVGIGADVASTKLVVYDDSTHSELEALYRGGLLALSFSRLHEASLIFKKGMESTRREILKVEALLANTWDEESPYVKSERWRSLNARLLGLKATASVMESFMAGVLFSSVFGDGEERLDLSREGEAGSILHAVIESESESESARSAHFPEAADRSLFRFLSAADQYISMSLSYDTPYLLQQRYQLAIRISRLLGNYDAASARASAYSAAVARLNSENQSLAGDARSLQAAVMLDLGEVKGMPPLYAQAETSARTPIDYVANAYDFFLQQRALVLEEVEENDLRRWNLGGRASSSLSTDRADHRDSLMSAYGLEALWASEAATVAAVTTFRFADDSPNNWRAYADPLVSVIEVGFGTASLGAQLRPFANTLVGVELSSAAIESLKNAAGGCGYTTMTVYDDVFLGDAVHVLPALARKNWEVVVAIDVLSYFGDLRAMFGAVSDVIGDGGVFVFDLSEAKMVSKAGASYVATVNGRWKHDEEKYVKPLLAEFGFKVLKREVLLPGATNGDLVHYVVGKLGRGTANTSTSNGTTRTL